MTYISYSFKFIKVKFVLEKYVQDFPNGSEKNWKFLRRVGIASMEGFSIVKEKNYHRPSN